MADASSSSSAALGAVVAAVAWERGSAEENVVDSCRAPPALSLPLALPTQLHWLPELPLPALPALRHSGESGV